MTGKSQSQVRPADKKAALRGRVAQLEARLVEYEGPEGHEGGVAFNLECLRLLLENSTDGINVCEYDPVTMTSRFVMLSDRCVEIAGRTREELMAAPQIDDFFDLLGEDREAMKARRHERIINGERTGLDEDLDVSDPLNFPNPFSETTTFVYTLSVAADVTITIYTLNGVKVRILEAVADQAGFQRLPWNGRDEFGDQIANGAYLYHFRAATLADQAVTRWGRLARLR